MSFGKNSTAAEVIAGHDLTGTEAVVTGGASGLGAETARVLAAAGARVVLAARDRARREAAAAQMRSGTGNPGAEFCVLDLGTLASVREFTAGYLGTGRPLHLLVNNAGIMATPLTRTAEGFESQFGVNHLGHFALATGLLPALRAAGGARVVVLSSRAHRRSDVDFDDPNYHHRAYDRWQAYGQSKTAAELRDMGWADDRGIRKDVPGWKTVEQGAATTIWAAVAAELDGVGGRYLEDCAIAVPWTVDEVPPTGCYLPYLLDPGHAERLWALSGKLTSASHRRR